MKCISPHYEMPMNEHVYTWISTYPAEQKLATSQQGSATPKTSKGYKVAGLPVDLSMGCCVVCWLVYMRHAYWVAWWVDWLVKMFVARTISTLSPIRHSTAAHAPNYNAPN